MRYAHLARAIALAFLVLLTLGPAAPATAEHHSRDLPAETTTSPMDLPWGG